MQDTSVLRALGSIPNCLYRIMLFPSDGARGDGAVCEVLV